MESNITHTTLVTTAKIFTWEGEGYFRVVCTCGVLGKNTVFAGKEFAEAAAAHHRESHKN